MSGANFLSPELLLTPTRLDILARYRYAHAIANKYSPIWGFTIYREFLEKSSLKSGYSEDGKNSFFDYFNSFNILIDSVSKNGFDSSIGSVETTNLRLINGAHRTALALVTNQQIPILDTPDRPSPLYNSEKIKSLGLSNAIFDDLFLAYTELKSSTRYLMLLGCDSATHDSFQSALENTPGFIGKKVINLTEIGIRRLLLLMYGSNDWWKNELLEEFVSLRFDDSRATAMATVCFLDLSSEVDLLDLKEKLRGGLLKNFKYDRNIHSADTHVETLLMAQAVLNFNSRYHLNNAPLFSEERILHELAGFEIPTSERSNFCVTGSSTLELFGIRSAADVDLVQGTSEIGNPKFNSSIKYTYQHSELFPDYSEKVYDPRHYMYVSGYKFLSLNSSLLYKLVRNQKKDVADVKLIQQFLLKDSRRLYSEISVQKKILHQLNLGLQRRGWERNLKSVYYALVLKLKRFISPNN